MGSHISAECPYAAALTRGMMNSGGGTRTLDLLVMSQASYQLLYPTIVRIDQDQQAFAGIGTPGRECAIAAVSVRQSRASRFFDRPRLTAMRRLFRFDIMRVSHLCICRVGSGAEPVGHGSTRLYQAAS